jgi:hypothetical protein
MLALAVQVRSCPYDDSAWSRMPEAERKTALATTDTRSLDQQCVLSLMRRLTSDPLGPRSGEAALGMLRRYLQDRGGLDRSLLSAAARICQPTPASKEWPPLLALWEKRNGRLQESVAALREAARLPEADSLYMVFNATGRLDALDLLNWAEVRGVLGQYSGAAAALCQATRREPRLVTLVQSQLVHLLSDSDTDAVRAALGAYRDCAMSAPGTDTLALGRWLAAVYGRFGLLDDERSALVEIAGKKSDVRRQLLELSFSHLAQRHCRQAIAAALPVVRQVPGDNLSELASTVLYQAYDCAGVRDSAVIWLDRARPSAPETRVNATVLYQRAGMRGKADSVLSLLPDGLSKDTLRLRQFLLSGRPDSASSSLSSMKTRPWWRASDQTAQLWSVRTALFGGAFGSLQAALDSLRFEPSWAYAAEMIACRYYTERLKSDPAALADWACLEYALYRGGGKEGVGCLHPQASATSTGQIVALRLIRALLDEHEIALASRLASQLDTVKTVPEQTYYCAEILAAQGELNQARKLLEGLIGAQQRDVFSTKARILLSRLIP